MGIIPFKRLATLGVASFAALLIALLPGASTFAETTSGGGLQISPALVELNGAPGKTYTITITVTNVTENELIFDGHVNDFAAKDETGAPSIILESDVESPTSIRDWVNTIPSFSLKAHEQRDVTAVVAIPTTAEPGGHYGVIRFSGRTSTGAQQGVELTASAGTLMLVRVDGAITEKLDLASFEVAHDKMTGSFFESGPLTFISRFTNSGTIHVKPIGQIEVKDAFGNSVGVLAVNSEKGNILPTSTRRFESTLDRGWLFGHYTADISIAYGTTGGAIVQSLGFWVIPWKLLLLGVIVLITIIYILRNLVKRYNRYIIKSAHKRSKQ